MGADGIAKKHLVIATDKPVMTAILLVGPSARQIRDLLNFIIDNSLVLHGGSNCP